MAVSFVTSSTTPPKPSLMMVGTAIRNSEESVI
jgi:hypothetical protein